MSAVLMTLPVVWAFAETDSAGHEESPVLGRKGPRALHLVANQMATGSRREDAGVGLELESKRLSLVSASAETVQEVSNLELLHPVYPLQEAGIQTGLPADVTVPATETLVVPVVGESEPKPEEWRIAHYRDYTTAMLARCESMSMEGGRTPSLLGRELFRGPVSSTRVHSFEDVVIYVHDVQGCIKRLTPGQRALVRRIALQGFTQGETAAMVGVPLRTVIRKYREALDALTRMFLQEGLMRRQFVVRKGTKKRKTKEETVAVPEVVVPEGSGLMEEVLLEAV